MQQKAFVLQPSHLLLRTFEVFAFAFGLPLLDIARHTGGGMWWRGVFWRGQRRTPAAFNAVSQWGWQRRAAGQLCLTLGSIFALCWIVFLSIPRVADGHREGQALLHGPPPPGRLRLLLILLFFSFLWGPELIIYKDNTRKRGFELFI